ncbi:MAG: NUDIX hydrolase [Acidimicrobiales bacterium]
MAPIEEWDELDRTVVFKEFSRVVERVDFRLPDTTTADFYIKAEGPAAGVLALTPNSEVILVKQYRPGPKAILNELPGGFVDPDEHPLDTVRREFLEETGYDGTFEFVGTCIDDAYSTMVRYCYVATDCHKIGEPKNTRTEQTEVVLLSLLDFRAQLRAGRLTDVEVGYLCLDHLNLL